MRFLCLVLLPAAATLAAALPARALTVTMIERDPQASISSATVIPTDQGIATTLMDTDDVTPVAGPGVLEIDAVVEYIPGGTLRRFSATQESTVTVGETRSPSTSPGRSTR